METYPERFGHGVSTTSRPPMEHEVDGRHYWFVEKTAFEEKADSEDGFRNAARWRTFAWRKRRTTSKIDTRT